MTIAEQMVKCEAGKTIISERAAYFARYIISDGDGYGLSSVDVSQIKMQCLGLYMQVASWQGLTGSVSLNASDEYLPVLLDAIAVEVTTSIKNVTSFKTVYPNLVARIFWSSKVDDAMLVWGPPYYTSELGDAYMAGGLESAEKKHFEICARG